MKRQIKFLYHSVTLFVRSGWFDLETYMYVFSFTVCYLCKYVLANLVRFHRLVEIGFTQVKFEFVPLTQISRNSSEGMVLTCHCKTNNTTKTSLLEDFK